MNSNQINKILRKEKGFLGCFPSDNLPHVKTNKSFSVIINTDRKGKTGDHWLALICEKNKAFYFDSFGCPILEFDVQKWVEKFDILYWSTKPIQPLTSKQCGTYCIEFIRCVRNLESYKRFLSVFKVNNPELNEQIIKYTLQK